MSRWSAPGIAIGLLLIATTTPLTASAEPVFVVPEPAALPSNLAPVVTYVGPAAIGLTTMALIPRIDPNAALLLSAAGLGVGHLYAGDPVRALAISAASPAVLAGSFWLGHGVGRFAGPNSGHALLGGLVGIMVGWGTFGGWSMYDAYLTAERVKAEHAKAQGAAR